jgi:hypothetical protein
VNTDVIHPLRLSGLVAVLVLWAGVPASARAAPLPPMNRVHVGLSVVGGPSALGIDGGLDSRLTRFIFVDAGGFITPDVTDLSLVPEVSDPSDSFHLRHGVYIGPGCRIPHAQPKSFSWEATVRIGMAAIWLADLEASRPVNYGSPYSFTTIVAGVGGLDLTVLHDKLGMRLGYREFVSSPFSFDTSQNTLFLAGQGTVEALYQFGGTK